MHALSLWQPWASLWLTNAKVHETRHWRTHIRGFVAVHAARKLIKNVDQTLDDVCRREFGVKWRLTLPTGAVIGVVNLVDCIPTAELIGKITPDDETCGNFDLGRFGFRRREFRLFPVPIPLTGRQTFFEVQDNLLQPQQLSR